MAIITFDKKKNKKKYLFKGEKAIAIKYFY